MTKIYLAVYCDGHDANCLGASLTFDGAKKLVEDEITRYRAAYPHFHFVFEVEDGQEISLFEPFEKKLNLLIVRADSL